MKLNKLFLIVLLCQSCSGDSIVRLETCITNSGGDNIELGIDKNELSEQFDALYPPDYPGTGKYDYADYPKTIFCGIITNPSIYFYLDNDKRYLNSIRVDFVITNRMKDSLSNLLNECCGIQLQDSIFKIGSSLTYNVRTGVKGKNLDDSSTRVIIDVKGSP